MRRLIVLGLALAMFGCSSEPPAEKVVEETTLDGLSSCEDLEAEIEARAIREMNARIDAVIDSIEGRGDGNSYTDAPVAGAPTPTATPAPSANEYTTTNTQERDVDEPDFVKNDGSRILTLFGKKLVVLAAWPAEATHVQSVSDLEGQPLSMILSRDRLVVFSAVFLQGLGNSGGYGPLPADVAYYAPSNAVKVSLLDVSGDNQRVLDEQYLEGSFLTARRTGSTVRIVSTAAPRGPALSDWPEGRVDWSNRSAARSAMERVRADNIKRIKASSYKEWIPRILSPGGGGGLTETNRQCSSFFAPNVPTRLAFTTISTMDLGAGQPVHSTMLNGADAVYASPTSLFLAAQHDWTVHPSETQVREDHTYLFQFDLPSDPRPVRYVASGGVPGQLVDQFSMNEEAGHLRVATMSHTWLGWQLKSSSNDVYVLHASGGRLVRVGALTALARDEQLYAARFEAQHGYLVTFRTVDPLFTLDLADPQHPKVAGELKVPGFSTYLHPIDTTHLLTIGREVSDDGRSWGGVQLQIFDVSNFASPVLQHRLVLGSRSSYSDAAYDYKAFTYFASRGLLAIPFSDWSTARARGYKSTLEVLRATPRDGIVSLGSVDHSDLGQGSPYPVYYGWTPAVRRSVMMDDYVYSISSSGVKVSDTRDLSRTVSSIAFANLQ
jgi:uncharacterized secreted protein with C-terminal beta-propeller domain